MSNSYIYRKIWEDSHGPIPKDYEGRSFEIHHVDGDKTNNVIDNLRCVSIREHYDIHWFQNDWGPCHMLAVRMKLSHEEISELASLAQKKNVENGTHRFLSSDFQKKHSQKRIEDGTHHLLGGKHVRQRVENGTHNLLGGLDAKKRVENGTHHCLECHICPVCGKIGKGAVMFRWHFDNCIIVPI